MTCTAPKALDLVAEVGATFIHRIIVTDTDGALINWTGAVGRLQVRTAYTGALVLELTQGAGLTFGTAGEIDIRIEATEDWSTSTSTPERTPVNYVWDLLVTLAGSTYRIAEGRFEVRAAVTTEAPA